MTLTLSTVDLEMEEAALLPAREVMSVVVVKVAELGLSNSAFALTRGGWLSSATAVAGQSVVVSQ